MTENDAKFIKNTFTCLLADLNHIRNKLTKELWLRDFMCSLFDDSLKSLID